MLQQLETSQWVPYPVELVFAFFANPANLPRLMPPKLQARIENARIQPPPPRPVAADLSRRFKSVAAGVGSEITISFYPAPWFPVRLKWLASIVEFEWNNHFTDVQTRGPFAHFRHRHEIQKELRDGQEGTLVSDLIEYELPFGWIGSAGGGIVRGQLASSFAFRQNRLLEVLAQVQAQAVRRE